MVHARMNPQIRACESQFGGGSFSPGIQADVADGRWNCGDRPPQFTQCRKVLADEPVVCVRRSGIADDNRRTNLDAIGHAHSRGASMFHKDRIHIRIDDDHSAIALNNRGHR